MIILGANQGNIVSVVDINDAWLVTTYKDYARGGKCDNAVLNRRSKTGLYQYA